MASFITDRIYDLQTLAVYWAMEPPSYQKTMFGFWLHGELASIYESGLLKEEDLVDFNATVQIMLDKILPQPYDGEDE